MNLASHRFGTFEGVFTPTILTIIGVILYLRLGWVVGSVGILGALLIILLAHVATITTSLALASMATNTPVGAGGFYALISKSLGLEVGGAIGIPLYLSQALGATLYITGFTELWVRLFPTHNFHLVATVLLVFLLILSYVSAKAAMKVQYVIMAVIALSLLSFFLTGARTSLRVPVWVHLNEHSFWKVFAIFFPAVTGIGAGAAMSGDLRNPKKSLPAGVLTAVVAGFFMYVAVAFWLWRVASPAELRGDYMIMVHKALWPWAVVAGIMGATVSSALGTLVGAPRILMALGQDKLIPFHEKLAARSTGGEPRTAILFTAVLVEISLLLWNLNAVASLLTMFFLMTYGMINLAVFIEKGIGIPSFRPSFHIPLLVPLLGSLWCLVVMYLINPIFAFVAQFFTLLLYVLLVKQDISAPGGDIRSGLFLEIAEWASRTAARMPSGAKTWKPNLMIPVETPKGWTHVMEFVRDIVAPRGTLRLFSVKILERGVESKITQLVANLFRKEHASVPEVPDVTPSELKTQLEELVLPVKKEGIFTATTVIESHDFLEGMSITTQVMKGIFFPPNAIFLTMSSDRSKDRRLEELIAIALRERLGILILALHPQFGFGERKQVHVWLRSRSPNINLALLVALQLKNNWLGKLRLISVAREETKGQTERFLRRVHEKSRLPRGTEILVPVGTFEKSLEKAPLTDLNIFGMSGNLSCAVMHDIAERSAASCLFVKDSGQESAFA